MFFIYFQILQCFTEFLQNSDLTEFYKQIDDVAL